MSGLTIQETADDCERSVSTRNGNAAHETTVHCHGFDLYVRRRGKGHPLLMINGLGNNVDMWGHAEDRLSKVAHTIVFDTPGTGRSRRRCADVDLVAGGLAPRSWTSSATNVPTSSASRSAG